MSGMDKYLAEYYGTGDAGAGGEDREKVAQAELFVKMAEAQGIDLDSLSEEQVDYLYNQTFKTAGDEGAEEGSEDGEDEGDDGADGGDVAEAAAEHEEKKAAAEKFAEADFLGRVMAHAYVQEMSKIAGEEKTAMKPPKPGAVDKVMKSIKGLGDKAKGPASRVSEFITGNKARAAKGRAEGYLAAAKGQGKKELRGMAGKHSDTKGMSATAIKHHAKRTISASNRGDAARAGVAGAALAGGGYAAGRTKESSSKLDELAAEFAVEKAASAGWNAEEVAERIAAVMILGPSDEGSKVASAPDVNGAIDIRSSELLEMAGYPVEW